jgi:very-short-patch-repair endonuclease
MSRSSDDHFVTMAAVRSSECRLVVADRAALAIAGRQHGAVTLAQLVRAGHTRGSIRQRLRSGWLRRIHRGVYLVGAIEPPLARAMAATLACGRGALLGHHPAAVLWALLAGPASGMHVTVPGRHVAGPAGITVHRTVLDLATVTSQRELARAVEQAQILNLVTDRSLNEQFARYPNHNGLAALREATTAEPRLTRSEAERRLLELIRAARLPEPETNVRVAGHEVDFLWREHALVVEVDGYAFHASRAAFERDRRRDAALKAHGIDTIRVSWTQIADEPMALVALLARATGSEAAA